METRTVVIPHDPARGPLTAVRRMLVHSSVAELQQSGLYDRYCALINSETLQRINELIGPGWMPIELVIEHYTALDRLGLSEAEVYAAGLRAGAKMGDALLVAGAQVIGSSADRSPWAVIGAFSRMGRRIYEGGSSQYVKLAENKLLIEHRGNPLFALRYYRVAHGGFMHKTFGDLGIELTDFKLTTYRHEGAQIDVKLTWK